MFSRKRALTNVLSLMIHCSEDSSVLLLLNEERGDYWIPSTKIDESLSWRDNLQIFKKQLFEHEIINEKLLKIYKIWTLEKDFLHLMFEVNVSKQMKAKYLTSLKNAEVGWYPCSQILKMRLLLRSFEIIEIILNCSQKVDKGSIKCPGDVISMGNLTEVGESDILVTPENCENPVYLDILESIGLLPSEQYNLYQDFFMHTYPCIYMNSVAFKKVIKRFSTSFDYNSLFRAADVYNRGFLTFKELLFLIAVMDSYTAHYGNFVQIRCQYIFRYYNKKQDGKLDYTELYKLLSDIMTDKNPRLNSLELSCNIESIFKDIEFQSNAVLTFENFYEYVLLHKIQDTGVLLRFDQSHAEVALKSDGIVPNRIVFSLPHPPEQRTRYNDEDYSVLLKTTILKPGETPFQIKDLKLLEDTMTRSVAENYKILSNLRLLRPDSLDLESKINELCVALKYYAMEIGQSGVCCGECEFEEKESFSWGSAYIENLGITLLMMCEYLNEILQAEPRLLEIEPPVFIMGAFKFQTRRIRDLHGNFHDLMSFERALWPNGVALSPTKLLFLGDYVDRGLSSLEVVMYLFANKIRNPNKLFMVRGNHEIREVQKMFTFQRECVYKFGSTLGPTVWKVVNDVFDRMPLAAVIDRKVFCCHGGIPPPWLCPLIPIINSIPCPLTSCEKQSPLAWTLMWNDPLKTGDARKSQQALELLVNEGFIPNTQRGTAYFFSCDALDRFLQTNNLSHVVRAHEVVRAGFQVHQRGKLLTVFSSSGYCGGNNYAGSILVADKLLQVFMVHTDSVGENQVS